MGQHDLSYRAFFVHRRMIQDLLREKVILPRFGLTQEEVSATLTLEDLETMLAESIDRWNSKIREEGLQQGLEEGLQKGEARLVLRQLRLKFGPLEPAIEDRVRSADAERLLQWGERIVMAESLQAVFED